jgi:hypothetical protein
LRFENAVQAVFAVMVLPGRRHPDPIKDDNKSMEKLVRGARRGVGRCAGGAAGASRPDPWRGGVGREWACDAREFVKA